MTAEHPFAPFVRILGKGPHSARALTFEEAKTAAAMIMDGSVEREQLGALLCLMRVQSETPGELAGFVGAVRDSIAKNSQPFPKVDLDWSSYAGKSRQPSWFLLAALLLAQNGIRVFMQVAEDHTEGRLFSTEALESLGLKPATSLADVGAQLDKHCFSFMPIAHLSPRLDEIMSLKPLLGLRTPVHTVGRMLNPLRASASMVGVHHPAYRPTHQEAAALLGDQRMAVFKGDGGEAERRPEKVCTVNLILNGQMSVEDWPALLPETAKPKITGLDPAPLKALWTAALQDEFAEASVTGTAAIALRMMGRAATPNEAQKMADNLWAKRDKGKIGA
jgi:anthranilate phosphoribosyltransferase